MILTCPECATSYFVDELRIPRGGRMVKCTNCGARWRAFQDPGEPEPSPPEDDLVVEGPPPESPPPVAEDAVAAPEPRTRRKPAPPPKPKRSPVLPIGLGVLAALALGAGAAIVLRHQIAGAIPATAPVFAAVGLPVNTLGLVIEGVASKPGFQGGRPVLSVTGAIRNVRKDAVGAPPIRVSLLDRNGKVVAGVAAQPLNAKVPPGATRYFALSLLDPPSGAHDLEVAFDPDAEVRAPSPPPPAAPPPAEAQPLPPGSPDALEAHD